MKIHLHRTHFGSALTAALVATVAMVAKADESRASIEPAGDGGYHLTAADAKFVGPAVHFDKTANAALGWSSNKDRAIWRLEGVAAGQYDVAITWSVSADDADQSLSLEIDGEYVLRGALPSTGGYDRYEHRVFGRILVTSGKHELVFHPGGRVRRNLLNLRAIDLVPLAKTADAAPAVAAAPPPLAVPAGFEVERVAGPPLVLHPMLASFDDRGRLYVAESAGVNSRGNALLESPPHSIRVLEDSDGDGRFDKSAVFADKLVFSQGILWHDGWVYVSSPPNFWRMRDTDGDGVADQREILVTGFANTGVSDDMHGASLGPDGRVYWCAGRFPHEIRRPGGPLVHKGRAPLILRCRPDGSEIEVVCGSQGNAVGVAFTDAGDCFASGTFLADDSMGPGLRDALIHCVDGGQYPVRGMVIHEHKRTGDLLPALTQLGVSASSDLTIYRDELFGDAYRGNLFSALFNMHKVVRHVLQPDGATFRCRNEDFLTSTSTDFHPTDVFEDADGSLLVVDTGGWFIIGCPTSRIAKPEVYGGIYRVRRAGATPHDDPRGRSIAWDSPEPAKLIGLLDDPRFAVRDRAMCELAARHEGAVAALRGALGKTSKPRTRLNAVWTLARSDGVDVNSAVQVALADEDAGVRQAAARVVGLRRDRTAAPRLMRLLRDDASPVRREAATALGRIGDAQAVPALLAALPSAGDRFLQHAIIFALIRIDDRKSTLPGLTDPLPEVRRGALLALDQMDHGELSREDVARVLGTGDVFVQSAALEVISRRRGWAGEITGLARQWLADGKLPTERQAALRGVLMAFAGESSVQKLIAEALAQSDSPKATRLLLLEVISRGESAELPRVWQPPLLSALRSADADIAREAVAAVAATSKTFGSDELIALARDEARPADLRVAAAAVAGRNGQRLPHDVFELLARQCGGDVAPVVRLAAARALGGARLEADQFRRAADLIAAAGPLELPALVGAYEDQSSASSGRQLVAALAKSPGLAGLPPARLIKLLEKFPPEVRIAAEPLLKRIAVDAGAQAARLAELQGLLSGGDAARGRQVFFGVHASCSACHRVGADGGTVGPNLAAIGEIRSHRDLLEAIVFPSASFARGFEPVSIATTTGKAYAGVIGRETSDAVFLRTAERAEIRLPRTEIEELAPSTVSIMPQGLDKTLAPEELRDLIEFLSSQRLHTAAGQ
jgi:putative heme-binding domain-containing protein